MEKPDKYHYHEVCDRAHTVVAMFSKCFDGHPAVEAEPEIKTMVEKIGSELGDLYQIAGAKAFEKDGDK